MSIDIIVGVFLIIIAMLMSYYLIVSKLVRGDKISNTDEQYSGVLSNQRNYLSPVMMQSKS